MTEPSHGSNQEKPNSPAVDAGGGFEQLISPASRAAATPMMKQFLDIKAEYLDVLLFYRMGDFYELFFEDAVVAAQVLGVTLTRRGEHMGEKIPMTGVPVQTADDYLRKLINSGYRVAVCEQVENPAEARKRGSKALMRREVRRLVTPGTLTEDKLLTLARSGWQRRRPTAWWPM